ncbi:sugar phosphate/phosphate translocator like protein [Verticillium longisporum]|nr:sugar phosphate/phosphate translocator like protein [Verticillium longisporum]
MSVADEKTRISGDVPRAEGPILPTNNAQAEKLQQKAQSNAIHPALYVIVWISLSSSVILFNKWILDTLNFRYPATTPVAVLLAGWSLGVSTPNMKVFLNVSVIVVGVIIASIGEIEFVWVGVIFQIGGVIFEALRLTMVQRLLSSADYKMDPLVSLYYFAPICAAMNLAVALVWEIPRCSMAEVYHVGLSTFFLNGMCAFLLNVSVVFLIGKTSSLVLTLCGVLKDVMLVAASMMIWGTKVSALQFFGYTIALGGMVFYKLGYEQLRGYIGEGSRQWAEFGQRKPVLRKLAVLIMSVFTFIWLLSQVAPTYAPEYDPHKLVNGMHSVSDRLGSDRL